MSCEKSSALLFFLVTSSFKESCAHPETSCSMSLRRTISVGSETDGCSGREKQFLRSEVETTDSAPLWPFAFWRLYITSHFPSFKVKSLIPLRNRLSAAVFEALEGASFERKLLKGVC